MTPAEHAQHYLAQSKTFRARAVDARMAGNFTRAEYFMDQAEGYFELARKELETTQ